MRYDVCYRLLKEMRGRGIVPNVITYSAAISACEKAGRWQEAVRIMEDMIAEGVTPNFITYSALVNALDKGGSSMEADLIRYYYAHGVANGVIDHWSKETSGAIDLHSFSIAMSKAAVSNVLQSFKDQRGLGLTGRFLIIITGVGKGSKGGKGVLKPALMDHFEVRQGDPAYLVS